MSATVGPEPPGDERYRGADVAAARRRLTETLDRAGKAGAAGEARRLVAHALGVEPARLTFEAARVLSDEEARALAAIEAERLRGRTVGRIVGRRAFHDIELAVRDRVLEPRDDTAALVELALPPLRAACDARGSASVWDIGCGSGAVVLALLAAEPRARGLGTDVSPDCVKATAGNARRLGIGPDRLTVRRADALAVAHADGFDLVVSNPPYIPSGEVAGLAPEVLHDPRAALDGGPDGLRFYRSLARDAAARLRPDGRLAVEIGAGQGASVREIMRGHGWRFVGATSDLGGHERALAFTPPDRSRRDGG